MPGSLFQRYKLKQCAIAADKHMSRDLQVRYFLEIRMAQGIQLIQEQILNPGPTELTWWQTDVVDHQQANFSTRWTLVMVWRRAWYCLFQPLICNVIDHDGANFYLRVC